MKALVTTVSYTLIALVVSCEPVKRKNRAEMSSLTFALGCNILTQSLELNVALVVISNAICLFLKASCCVPKLANFGHSAYYTWMYYVPIVK